MSEPSMPVNEATETPRARGGVARKMTLAVAVVGLLAWGGLAIYNGGPTRSLARSLRGGDATARREAAQNLGQPDVDDPSVAIPALAEAVSGDAEDAVRAESARSLGLRWCEAIRKGTPGAPTGQALDALFGAIADRAPAVREAALAIMPTVAGTAGEAAGEPDDRSALGDPSRFVARMAESLADPDEKVRAAAETALAFFPAQIDPALPALLKDAATDPAARAAPNRGRPGIALRKARPTKKAVPGLIESLKSPDPMIRYYAAILLAKVGPEASEAVPALVEALKSPPADDPREDPARAAASALGQVGPRSSRADEALAALKEANQSADPGRARAIAGAIQKFDPKSGSNPKESIEAVPPRDSLRKVGP